MDPTPNDEAIARALFALGNPARLALLKQLRTPKLISEIRVTAGERDELGARTISRQAVREHIERLLEIGVVSTQPTARERGSLEYSMNHQALYALSEEFRGLARLRPESEPMNPTEAAPQGRQAAIRGPCLVLVKGLDEGRVFPLQGSRDGWTIGRRRGVEVALDFDPFVSSENARILRGDGRWLLQDLAESKNGTSLDLRPMARGSTLPLASGALIGVGRSMLLFRE